MFAAVAAALPETVNLPRTITWPNVAVIASSNWHTPAILAKKRGDMSGSRSTFPPVLMYVFPPVLVRKPITTRRVACQGNVSDFGKSTAQAVHLDSRAKQEERN
jgi:hypothetical protein